MKKHDCKKYDLKKYACAGFWFFYNDKLKELVEKENGAFQKVKSALIEVIMEERAISEKSFNEIKEIEEEIEQHIDRVLDLAEKMSDKRPSYCAEILYDELFSDNLDEEEVKENDACGCTECDLKYQVTKNIPKSISENLPENTPENLPEIALKIASKTPKSSLFNLKRSKLH